MRPEGTHEGKWVLYDASTGERLVRWPVDARELLASGAYTAVPPIGGASYTAAVAPAHEVVADDPMPHVTAAVALLDAVSPTGATLALAPTDAPAPVAQMLAFPLPRTASAGRRKR